MRSNLHSRCLLCWEMWDQTLCTLYNCQSVFYHLHNIRQIRKFLSYENTKSLVQAVIMAHIDYCNSLLYGVPAVHLSKLQCVQNSAARLISFTPRYNHISPVLFDLHWLPVKSRILYKVAVTAFIVIHSLAPGYLGGLINTRKNLCHNLRSDNGIMLHDPTAKFKRTLGNRSFTPAAPKTWNSLPAYIRNETNWNNFKCLLKTYYFREAFNNLIS